jgi:hypothetical protein
LQPVQELFDDQQHVCPRQPPISVLSTSSPPLPDGKVEVNAAAF